MSRPRPYKKLYALIVCDLGDAPPTDKEGPAVGLDVGLKVFLADANGETVENPRHYRRSQRELRRERVPAEERLAPEGDPPSSKDASQGSSPAQGHPS